MHFHFDLEKIKNLKPEGELGEIFQNIALKNFALSMVSIFIPIYLLELGYALQTVFLFFIGIFATQAISSPFISSISSRIGLKHTIAISLPILLLFLLGLNFLGSLNIPLYLVAFFGGLSTAMYFVPFNADFIRSSDDDKAGKEVGYLTAVAKISLIFGPIIGALIISQYGFGVLFGVVITIILFSMVTLLKKIDITPGDRFSWNYMFTREHAKYFFVFGIQGFVNAAEAIVWPLFIYLFISGTGGVGTVGALITTGIVIFSLAVGKLSDKISVKNIIRSGAILYSSLWIVRHFVDIPSVAFISSFFAGAFLVLLNIPIMTMAVHSASKEGKETEFSTMREIGLNFGRIALMLLAIFVVDITGTFLFTSGLSLLLVFV